MVICYMKRVLWKGRRQQYEIFMKQNLLSMMNIVGIWQVELMRVFSWEGADNFYNSSLKVLRNCLWLTLRSHRIQWLELNKSSNSLMAPMLFLFILPVACWLNITRSVNTRTRRNKLILLPPKFHFLFLILLYKHYWFHYSGWIKDQHILFLLVVFKTEEYIDFQKIFFHKIYLKILPYHLHICPEKASFCEMKYHNLSGDILSLVSLGEKDSLTTALEWKMVLNRKTHHSILPGRQNLGKKS